MTPRIHLVAFEVRAPSHFIFVAVPDERNRYLRTERCVALVGCPHCKVPAGVPCLGAWNKYHGGVHYVRRNAARGMFPPQPSDVLHADTKSVPPEEFWL